jgi:hypothetical protein
MSRKASKASTPKIRHFNVERASRTVHQLSRIAPEDPESHQKTLRPSIQRVSRFWVGDAPLGQCPA